ncbi:GH92 family glycosyl hydrolase [Sunxiuqinia sp. sy24]|uniref:GH92 family glycosyl hydrolase n=1 Tax=Sunxiuqinia sp. sy24 TaxID=3461495 RepID=UPI0040459A35
MKFYNVLRIISIFIVMGVLGSCSVHKSKQPVDYINPIIGASTSAQAGKSGHGLGKTFPGAATPFGLVQLSPDTRTGGDNGPGYSWHHQTIEGVSFTHMSGIGWYGDFGNFLTMPTTGELKTVKGRDGFPEEGYRSRYSHDTEITKAGYYSVMLDDYNIKAELTAAPRSGIIRFTYPKNELSRIQIDLSRRVGGTSVEQYVKVVDDNTIAGWMKCTPEGGGWGNGDGKADYTVYFWCQFSNPLRKYGMWTANIPDSLSRKRQSVTSDYYQQIVADAKVVYGQKEARGKHLGFFTEFETEEQEQVVMKSGISFVNMEGAKENLEHDISGWDFDDELEQNRQLWNNAMEGVSVEGGTEDEKTIFYTALYHTMIDPRNFSDVNGNYVGADKNIHKANGFTYRTIFSGWDVFRSQFPLQTIINPQMVNDEINSFIQMADLSGKKYFPRWEIVNAYSGCMLGNPAVSVVVDAYEKGIRNFDIEKAYTFSKNSVAEFGNGERGYTPYSISHTLEYAYTDWCMARFAESLGKESLAQTYYEKSKAYRNIWNNEVKWFRAKKDSDSWLDWKGKEVHGQGCTESNPYQQGWFVPHDITGLVELMGEDYFTSELIAFFENAPDDFLWNDFYNHPNEPVHHVPFLFNEVGMPWLTQRWTREICEKAYGTDVLGLCGNEDVGQLSAWYVLSSIGIHPICPGDNKYQITSPVFDKTEIRLDENYYPGGKFTIIAHKNSSENIYIQSVKLNGEPLDRYYITHQEIVEGGTLELEMGAKPKK